MKTLFFALLLSVACLGQNRALFSYPCDPPPDFLSYVILDCSGNIVSTSMVAPTMPCRGWDVCTVPLGATGRLEMVAWVWDVTLGRPVPTASKTVPLGCP